MAQNTPPQKSNRALITCGIIAAALACLGVLGAGLFAVITLALPAFKATATPTAVVAQVEQPPTRTPAPTAAPAESTRTPAPLGEIPFQAVVQILAIVEVDGEEQVGWSGSGSIISPDGYILTNAHVVLSDRFYEVKALVVALTVAQDAPPEPRYRMELLQADKALDIAVGRINADQDGNPIDPAGLDLPTAPLGVSDTLNLGDPLTILGYPGIGGETITLTRGEVSGFTSDPEYGSRAFIKTSATIAGGNSGGLAANAQGELIGVPTQLGYGGEDQYIDCRVLADTNRDGSVDDQDSCVPTGGFINALRPITLALPLIEAAKRGEVNINTGPQESAAELPQPGEILFEDDFSDPDSGWGGYDDADGFSGYFDGAYQIGVNQPNYMSWAYQDTSYSDVIVSVDMRVKQSAVDGDYGVMCRVQDADNFYGLEISEDGYFTIYKYVDGEFTALSDWQYSDLIVPDEYTRVTAACVGTQLTIAIDDTILASVEDDTFASGTLGLIAGTFDTPNVIIEYDNFIASQP